MNPLNPSIPLQPTAKIRLAIQMRLRHPENLSDSIATSVGKRSFITLSDSGKQQK